MAASPSAIYLNIQLELNGFVYWHIFYPNFSFRTFNLSGSHSLHGCVDVLLFATILTKCNI